MDTNIIHGITVDYTRDKVFTDSGLTRLKSGYMLANEDSPQERFAFVSKEFSSNAEHAQRLYDYSSKLWLSYSTPILSYGKTKRSLPISCYASYLGDSISSILDTSAETRMLAVGGGGVGLHVGLRPGDVKSSGIIPHLKTYDVDTLAFKQGTTRRGATAAYIDINHPEIIDFLEMRKPTGGDPNRKCLNLHHGIMISDDFMDRVNRLSLGSGLSKEAQDVLDQFPLINPHDGSITETISVRDTWERILTTRMETGEPYLIFGDTANDAMHPAQKEKGLKIHGSNLCAEILLPTGDDRTFVCCLSSLNLEKFDEWKDDKLFIADVAEMLDNVLDVFIEKASLTPEMANSVRSAAAERSIGIGALGFHAFLQKNNIPFESALAVGQNKRIFGHIRTQLDKAQSKLALERGEPSDLISDVIVHSASEEADFIIIKSSDLVEIARPDEILTTRAFNIRKGDYLPAHNITVSSVSKKRWAGKRRNTYDTAIAPNASTSLLLDTSPSIELYRANVYLEKGVNGSVTHKNKYLKALLESLGHDDDATWGSIIANDGSVSHLKFLDEWQKDVFKTAPEVDQTWVIQHAGDRQEYISQSQSLNLFFQPDVNVEILHLIHLMAWKTKVKSLYYLRSDTVRKADKVGNKVIRERIEDMKDMLTSEENICVACEG